MGPARLLSHSDQVGGELQRNLNVNGRGGIGGGNEGAVSLGLTIGSNKRCG